MAASRSVRLSCIATMPQAIAMAKAMTAPKPSPLCAPEKGMARMCKTLSPIRPPSPVRIGQDGAWGRPDTAAANITTPSAASQARKRKRGTPPGPRINAMKQKEIRAKSAGMIAMPSICNTKSAKLAPGSPSQFDVLSLPDTFQLGSCALNVMVARLMTVPPRMPAPNSPSRVTRWRQCNVSCFDRVRAPMSQSHKPIAKGRTGPMS